MANGRDVFDNVTLLEGAWAVDEPAVIITVEAAAKLIKEGELLEAVKQALLAIELSGKRLAVLRTEK